MSGQTAPTALVVPAGPQRTYAEDIPEDLPSIPAEDLGQGPWGPQHAASEDHIHGGVDLPLPGKSTRRAVTEDPEKVPRPRGAGGFYVVAAMATGLSADTSWRFFGERLHITLLPERIGMFAVIEVVLVACAWAMRANVRRSGTPGPARILAWAVAGLAAYAAIVLSGPVEGTARVLLGPVLAIVALHMALGIEVAVRKGQRSGVWARLGRELRERALSRFGLADDSRDALARTRDRAADRAARLAVAKRTPFRSRRLARALRSSQAATNPAVRSRMLANLAALQHMAELTTLDTPSPWTAPTQVLPRSARTTPVRPARTTPVEVPASPAWTARDVPTPRVLTDGEDLTPGMSPLHVIGGGPRPAHAAQAGGILDQYAREVLDRVAGVPTWSEVQRTIADLHPQLKPSSSRTQKVLARCVDKRSAA